MSCFTFDSLFSNSICLASLGQNKEVEQPVTASHFLLFFDIVHIIYSTECLVYLEKEKHGDTFKHMCLRFAVDDVR